MSSLVGPNGRPIQSPRKIPDELLIQALQDHETRLNALAAQSIHLGIMVEYLTDQLSATVEGFELDEVEFTSFRERRFEEMKEEATAFAQSRQAQAANGGNINLNEFEPEETA